MSSLSRRGLIRSGILQMPLLHTPSLLDFATPRLFPKIMLLHAFAFLMMIGGAVSESAASTLTESIDPSSYYPSNNNTFTFNPSSFTTPTGYYTFATISITTTCHHRHTTVKPCKSQQHHYKYYRHKLSEEECHDVKRRDHHVFKRQKLYRYYYRRVKRRQVHCVGNDEPLIVVATEKNVPLIEKHEQHQTQREFCGPCRVLTVAKCQSLRCSTVIICNPLLPNGTIML